MGSLSLLQGIFPTQGSNPGFLHCRQILYHLSYERRPRSTLPPASNCAHAQLCPTLCVPMDCSPSGSSIRGIFQARILQWVAISFCGGIFPTQGLNPRLLCCLHCRWTLYQYHHLKALTLLGRTQILCFLTAAPLGGGPTFGHRLKHAEGLHVAQPHQYPWDSWA